MAIAKREMVNLLHTLPFSFGTHLFLLAKSKRKKNSSLNNRKLITTRNEYKNNIPTHKTKATEEKEKKKPSPFISQTELILKTKALFNRVEKYHYLSRRFYFLFFFKQKIYI